MDSLLLNHQTGKYPECQGSMWIDYEVGSNWGFFHRERITSWQEVVRILS